MTIEEKAARLEREVMAEITANVLKLHREQTRRPTPEELVIAPGAMIPLGGHDDCGCSNVPCVLEDVGDRVGRELDWDWPGTLLELGTPEFTHLGGLVMVGNGPNAGKAFRRIGGRGRQLRFEELGKERRRPRFVWHEDLFIPQSYEEIEKAARAHGALA